MAKYIELHPDNPQPRLVSKIVDEIKRGGVIALPTDSGYAIACQMGNKAGLDRITQIRQLGAKHNFSFLCANFAQIGELVIVDNKAFRTIKALTPGPYTFILKGTKEVPRMTLNAKKHTAGVRLPQHAITQAILEELGEPLLCSTLIMPGETEPLNDGWTVQDTIGHLLDVVVEGPVGEAGPTSVIDYSEGYPEVVREGAGDTSLFE